MKYKCMLTVIDQSSKLFLFLFFFLFFLQFWKIYGITLNYADVVEKYIFDHYQTIFNISREKRLHQIIFAPNFKHVQLFLRISLNRTIESNHSTANKKIV